MDKCFHVTHHLLTHCSFQVSLSLCWSEQLAWWGDPDPHPEGVWAHGDLILIRLGWLYYPCSVTPRHGYSRRCPSKLPNTSNYLPVSIVLGFSGGSGIKESICQCRRHGFNSWVEKIPWSRELQPPPVFLAWRISWTGELDGLYSPWGHKSRIQLSD